MSPIDDRKPGASLARGLEVDFAFQSGSRYNFSCHLECHMMHRQLLSLLLAWTIGWAGANAQMINTTVPFQSGQAGFWESSGVAWSLRGENWFANFGGGGPLLPPVAGGNVDPGAGLTGGVGFSSGGVSGSLGFQFAQGSTRSVTSSAPSVTTINGVPGSVNAGVIRPFVTGFTPIVGDYAGALSHLHEANRAGTAIRQSQFQSLRQSQQTLQNRKLSQYLRRAARAESEGNKKMVRANYRSAIAIAPQPLKTQLIMRLRAAMAAKPAGTRKD